MSKFIDLAGRRFGRLTVVAQAAHIGKQTAWDCVCDCGGAKRTLGNSLTRGVTASCGCLHHEMLVARNTTHGLGQPPEYKSWVHMRERCSNPNNPSYSNYGGRGIAVCSRWQTSFSNFIADMGPRSSSKHSLDRINNEGNYGPENCRWATKQTQANNTRRVRKLTYEGETHTITEWANLYDIPRGVLAGRINRKWPIQCALTVPVSKHR